MIRVPIFINCRDRVSDLRNLVSWLEQAGHERITLLDNDSTYEPLLEYLESTPHSVIRLGHNYGSRALWEANLVPQDERFVYSDPDLLPIEECPYDLVDYLWEVCDKFPAYKKVGAGLYLEDVPENMISFNWERELVGRDRELAPGVFRSLVDTTFALYRPGVLFAHEGIRTGFPYQMRHLPWYRLKEPTAEEAYYLDRAIQGMMGSAWAAVRHEL